MTDLLAAVRRHRLGLLALVVGFVVAWAVWSARGALPAFIIGLALAFALDPVVTLLERWRLPRWAGVLLSYAGVVGLVWAFVAFAVPPIAEQTRELVSNLPRYLSIVTDAQQDLLSWYRSVPLPPEVRQVLDDSIASAEGAFVDALRNVLGPAVTTVVRTAGFILGLVVIPVWLFYVLKDRSRIQPAVERALPEPWRPDAANLLGLMARVGGRWIRGQLLLGFAIFLASLVGLTVLTFVGFVDFGRFALVLAVIAGVLEWFPIIGPIVAAIPAILIGLTISPAAAVAAAILYTAIQQLENNLLVPKVMGDAVELHPAVMIVALVAGGALFGLAGAVLAAPLVATGRDLYRYAFARMHDHSPDSALAMVVGPTSGRGETPPSEQPPTQAALPDVAAAPPPGGER